MPRVPNTVVFQATSDDRVWYLSGNKPLVCNEHGLKNLQQWNSLSEATPIIDEAFVPAMLVNARLLRALYAQHVAGRIKRLWLTPPPAVKIPAGGLLFPPRDLELNHDKVDKLLRRFIERRYPSQGGPRRVTQVDLDTFALHGERAQTDTILVERHPGWAILSFIPMLDQVAATRLLSAILDPRWYVDPYKPDSQHRLRDAFGLGQHGIRTMQAILDRQPVGTSRNALFAKLVADTWYSVEREAQAPYAGSSNSFPWSLYFRVAKNETSASAMLKTCRLVLSTVCAVWLDNLTPPRKYATTVHQGEGQPKTYERKLQPSSCYNPQLFVPAYCFLPTEYAEWQRHIAQWRSTHSAW